MSHPPSGPPWYPGQPEQNQPQYGSPAYPPAQPPYGGDPNYGGQPYGGDQAYPQESYTTEPPYSGQPYQSEPPYSAQPYSGQPYSGAGAPGYGGPQPAYDQSYQQPGYAPGQPYVPLPGPPGYQPQPSRNRGGLIALIVGAVVLLLVVCGVGGALLLTSGDDSGDTTTSPTSGPTGGATTPGPTSTVKPEYPATITLPTNLAGMSKVENASLQKTADEIALTIKSGINAESATAGFYAPANGTDLQRIVALIGATTRISSPSSELDDAFRQLGVSGATRVDAGPLGGEMRCGNASSNGQAYAVCAWADGGSLAIGMFFNRTVTDSASLLRQIRSEVLRRG